MDAATGIRPATEDCWGDLERLFGRDGAWGGCWCMYLRETAREFEQGCANGGAGNRAQLKALVESGAEPGLLAYRNGDPVGWVAVAPRDQYGRVLRSPVHRPVDAATRVWAITCFFIAGDARGQGLADALLAAAVEHARRRGARLLEAYPTDTDGSRQSQQSMWRGSLTQFRRAGFDIIAQRKPRRPIVRLVL